MTAYTFLSVQDRTAVFVHPDGLVPSVRTGNRASAAAYTFVAVEFGEDHRIPFEHIGIFADIIQGSSPDLLNAVETFFRKVIVEAGFEIVDDAVAVLHDGCSDHQTSFLCRPWR